VPAFADGRLTRPTVTGAQLVDGIERRSLFILTTKTGHPFKRRYLSRLWKEITESAGLVQTTLPGHDKPVDLHLHDLRGTAVALLSEAGSTPQQIATITEHTLQSVKRIFERYLARTRGLAEQAVANFENSPRTKFANQMQTKPVKNKPRSRKAE
jgi:hypothetical protein